MDRCWILVGMMGAGKSSVGRALAQATGREFIDTDLLLQHRFGRPVHLIFDVYGEQAFRQHETSVLKSLQPGPAVLATGGGIVTREENWVELKRLGTVIYLEATPDALVQRLSRSKKRRPLLQNESLEERVTKLLDARKEMYARADVRVALEDEDVSQATAKVLSALKERGEV